MSAGDLGSATGCWGFVYMSRLPLFDLFGFMSHTARWLWPFGAFLSMYALAGLTRHVASADRPQMVAAAAGIGSLAIAVMPWSHSAPIGPMGALGAMQESALEVRDSLGVLDGWGLVYVQVDDEPFSTWTDTNLAELTRRGNPYVVNEPYRVVQLGERRRFTGHADVRLRIVTSPYEELESDVLVFAAVPGVSRPAFIPPGTLARQLVAVGRLCGADRGRAIRARRGLNAEDAVPVRRPG